MKQRGKMLVSNGIVKPLMVRAAIAGIKKMISVKKCFGRTLRPFAKKKHHDTTPWPNVVVEASNRAIERYINGARQLSIPQFMRAIHEH